MDVHTVGAKKYIHVHIHMCMYSRYKKGSVSVPF